jgi:hypothetical protein
MEHARYTKFMKAVYPLIVRLAGEWFPPDKKTPDGKYYYACGYCDMGCGGHEKHDDDCWSDMARRVLAEFERIEADTKYDTSWVTGETRTLEESREMRDWNKARVVLRTMYGNLMHVVPMDYNAPENRNVVCTCNLFHHKREEPRRHAEDCLHQVLAEAIIGLLTVSS